MKILRVILIVAVAMGLSLGLNAAMSGKETKGKNWTVKNNHDGITIDIDLSSLSGALEGLKDMKFDLSNMEAFEAKMEAWGERFEKDMEGLGEKLEMELSGLEGLEALKGLKNINVSIKGLDSLEELPEILKSNLKGLECLKDLDIKINFDGDKKKKK